MNSKKDRKLKDHELEELYIDEDDRTRILLMPEFERERIIAERVSK